MTSYCLDETCFNFCSGLPHGAFGQLSITNLNIAHTIDFESTIAGVNNGAFLANQDLSASPTAGGLDTDAWSFSDVRDGEVVGFGGASVTFGQYKRGANDGSGIVAGIYSFDTGGSNHSLGIKPNSSVFNNGSITLRVQNNTGAAINQFVFSYHLYSYGSNNRWGMTVATSTDNSTFSSAVGDLAYTTSGTAGWSGPGVLSSTFSGLSLADGEYFYIRLSGDTFSSTPVDSIAIDDISLTASAVPEPSTYAALAGLAVFGLVLLRRRRVS